MCIKSFVPSTLIPTLDKNLLFSLNCDSWPNYATLSSISIVFSLSQLAFSFMIIKSNQILPRLFCQAEHTRPFQPPCKTTLQSFRDLNFFFFSPFYVSHLQFIFLNRALNYTRSICFVNDLFLEQHLTHSLLSPL